jgi:acylphosphatase
VSETEDTTQAHVVARGRVQGVYYRGSLKQQADAHGVSGWVRNRPDGAVEALLQGPHGAVVTVADWMRGGPPRARVESVDIEWTDVRDPMQGFEVVG